MAEQTMKTMIRLDQEMLDHAHARGAGKKTLRIAGLVLLLMCAVATSALAVNTGPSKKTPPANDASTSMSAPKRSRSQGLTLEKIDGLPRMSTSGTLNLMDPRAAMAAGFFGRKGPMTSGTLSIATPNANAPMNFNLKGAGIDQILQFISDTTGKPVLKRKDVMAEINIVTPRPVSRQETLDLVYDSLRMDGFAVIESDDKVQIMPVSEMREQDLLTVPNDIPTSLALQRSRLIRRVFTLQQAEASSIKDYLAPLLPKYASINTDERTNKLILVDTVRNCQRCEAVIKELDSKGSKQLELKTIPLKYADATEVANVLVKFSDAGSGAKAQGGGSSSTPPSQPMPSPPQDSRMGMGMPPGMSMGMGMGMPPGMSGGGSPAAPPPPIVRSSPGLVVLPDTRTNSILLAASREKMLSMLDLVAKLDVEKPRNVTIHTVTLKYADVERVADAIRQVFQRIKGQSYKDTVEVIPATRGNSLVVLASDTNFKTIQDLVTQLDTEDARKRETRTYVMKFVDASETAEELGQLYSNLQSRNSSRYSSYGNYGYGGGDSDRQQVSFVPVVRSNSIMVIAPPTDFAAIEPLISELDQPVDKDQVLPKVYYIKYANAKDVEKVLSSVFGTTQDDSSRGGDYYDYYYWRGNETKDQSTVGRLLGKISFSSDENTNSIIATTNNKSNYAVVDEMIARLDKSMPEMANTMIYPLENASATSLSATLNLLFGKPSQQQGRGSSYYDYWGGQNQNKDERAISNLIGQVRFADDPRTNSLIVTTASPNFPVLRGLIKELDQPEPQVLAKVRVVEVASDNSRKVGLRWTPDPTIFRQEDLDNAVQVLGGLDLVDTFGTKAQTTAVRSSGLKGKTSDQVMDAGNGIISSTVNLDLLLQLLVKNTDAHMTNSPVAYISNNKMGKIFGGQNIPRLSGSQTTPEGSVNRTFVNEDIGVTLELTPHINKNGNVVMSVHLITSQPTGESRFGSDVLDKREYNTEVAVESKDTVVLGGIQLTKQHDIVRKLPILGSIPLVKFLFQNQDTVDQKSNLYVFITPTVVRSKAEAERITKEAQIDLGDAE